MYSLHLPRLDGHPIQGKAVRGGVKVACVHLRVPDIDQSRHTGRECHYTQFRIKLAHIGPSSPT